LSTLTKRGKERLPKTFSKKEKRGGRSSTSKTGRFLLLTLLEEEKRGGGGEYWGTFDMQKGEWNPPKHPPEEKKELGGMVYRNYSAHI